MSGFLITYLLLREERTIGTISLTRFYGRRAIRILPPVVFFLLILLIGSLMGMLSVPVTDCFAGLLFVRNFFGTSSETAHLWSLGIEEQFYLVWPFLVAFLGRNSRMVVVVALVAILPAWMQLSYWLAEGAAHVNSLRTDLRLLPLIVGAMLALGLTSQLGSKMLTRASVTSVWLAVAAITFLGLAQLTNVFEFRVVRTIVPICCYFSIAIIINHGVHRQESWLTRILEFSPVAWLGRLSYSLYLWQQFFVAGGSSAKWYQEFPINLAAGFACAIFSYYFVEQPLLRWRGRLR